MSPPNQKQLPSIENFLFSQTVLNQQYQSYTQTQNTI